MAYEFTKLSEVPTIPEPSSNATVFIEENGEIKRVAGSSIVGSSGLIVTVNSSDITYGK